MIAAALVAACTLVFASFATATPPPGNLTAMLILRTIAYDHDLPNRAGDAITILVIRRNGSDGADVKGSLEQLASVQSVAGLPVRVETHNYDNASGVAEALAATNATIAYVAPGVANATGAIAAVTEARNVVLIAPDGEDMPNGGTIGFFLSNERPTIAIDESRAQAIGMELDADLLGLATLL